MRYLLLTILLFLSSCPAPPKELPLASQLEKMMELSTLEWIYDELIYQSYNKKLLFVETRRKEALFSIRIAIRAGFQFDREKFLDYKKDTLLVYMPPPQILSIDAKEESIRQYFVRERRSALLYPEFQDWINLCAERVKKDALQKGILKECSKRGRKIIKSYLHSLGYQKIKLISQGAQK